MGEDKLLAISNFSFSRNDIFCQQLLKILELLLVFCQMFKKVEENIMGKEEIANNEQFSYHIFCQICVKEEESSVEKMEETLQFQINKVIISQIVYKE